MKTISAAMREHLDQEVTTLCTCWRIKRRDGTVMGFTDHDDDVVFQGQRYIAQTGYLRSAISSSAGTTTDDLEVTGILDDESITRDDLRNGIYDFAEVWIYYVNWAAPDIGGILLRRGQFGEAILEPSGRFQVQLVGLLNRYTQTVGNVIQRECRAQFGDAQCGLTLEAKDRIAGQAYRVGERVRVKDDGNVATVSANIENADFEESAIETSDQHPGWLGNFRVTDGNIRFLPQVGTRFAIGVDVVGGMQQILDMHAAGSFMAQHFIDAGQRRIDFSYLQAVQQFGWQGYAGLAFFDDEEIAEGSMANGPDNTIVDPALAGGVADLIANAPYEPLWERTWVRRSLSTIAPPGKRWLRLRLYWAFPSYLEQPVFSPTPEDLGLACFDDIVVLYRDTSVVGNDPRAFGNVEWECTSAGTTARPDIPVSFDPNGPDIVQDGTVTWRKILPKYHRVATVSSSARQVEMDFSDLDVPDGFFNSGVVEILDGRNRGERCEIELSSRLEDGGHHIKLFVPMPADIEPGTAVKLVRGCSKTTKACNGYGNIKNYRGEPHVPGTDTYLTYGNPLG